MKTLKTWSAAAVMASLSCTAYAVPLFEGRLADGKASATCSTPGQPKCAMFYNPTLNVTILNDWNIGTGFWSATAAAGSAQALVESAGDAQTDFKGWFLPTGHGLSVAGPLNQYLSIWRDAGSSFTGLQAQFHNVQSVNYWSSTEVEPNPPFAWIFGTRAGSQWEGGAKGFSLWAVAVRPGDVATAVPEPQTYALMLMGIGVVMLALRRRPR